MNFRKTKNILTTCVVIITLSLSTAAQAVITLGAGETTGNYSDNVAVTVTNTLRGECKGGGGWECSDTQGLNSKGEAQLEIMSEFISGNNPIAKESWGSVSIALGSEQYKIDSLSSLNAQITGQVRYDGTMYVFQYNGADILGFVEFATGQLGTKVQTIITVALVDVTDPDNKFEVGNTTVLDAECEAAYEIALGISVLANKCTHVLQPTYSFNAIVQPDHIYEIVVELRCDGTAGSPGFNLIGCKYDAEWDKSLDDGAKTALKLLGSIGDYVTTIDAIGRPGGLIWANSTISLGQDVRAERNVIIKRLESTLGIFLSLQRDAIASQHEEIKTNINNNVLEANAKLESMLVDNGKKTEIVNNNVIKNGKKIKKVIRLVKTRKGRRRKYRGRATHEMEKKHRFH